MKYTIHLVLLLILSLPILSVSAVWPNGRPKLIVFIVIDQFRADFLSRYESDFQKDGFKALIADGAYYPYGEYDILQCMTGPGHATVLTGAYPYQMGIPINDWYDQSSQAEMYCVEDSKYETVGAKTTPHVGTSPKNLIGTTVGDELKNVDAKARVFSLSLKDRAAILMGGHRANLSVWYDFDSKIWVSSSYYLKNKQLPDWLKLLNQDKKLAECNLAEKCGVEVTQKLFDQLLVEEKLGQKDSVDLIAVSFSTHDFAGHAHGPNSEQIKDITLAEDNSIANMRKLIESKVPGGLANVLFVLTGDHGVSPSPSFLKSAGIDSGNIDERELSKEVEASITKSCGNPKKGKWIGHIADFNFYIDEKSVSQSKCKLSKVQTIIKSVLKSHSEFSHVFTQDEYDEKKLPPGIFARQIEKTIFKGRSGHVIGIQKPFYINKSRNAANHLSGYVYDRTVPILFSGFGIKPGLHSEKAEVVDIAPTLSFILGILPPALSEGKVLSSALKNQNK